MGSSRQLPVGLRGGGATVLARRQRGLARRWMACHWPEPRERPLTSKTCIRLLLRLYRARRAASTVPTGTPTVGCQECQRRIAIWCCELSFNFYLPVVPSFATAAVGGAIGGATLGESRYHAPRPKRYVVQPCMQRTPVSAATRVFWRIRGRMQAWGCRRVCSRTSRSMPRHAASTPALRSAHAAARSANSNATVHESAL